MLENFSKKLRKKLTFKRQWWLLIALPVWVYAMFFAAQIIVGFLFEALKAIGVPLESVGVVSLNTIIAVIIYALTLGLVVYIPWWLGRRRTTLKLLGVSDWPTILEVLMSPLVFVAYLIFSSIVMAIAIQLFSIDTTQQQALPFSQTMLATHTHYFLAFFTLVVLAPVVEELLFRGYLYGKLRNSFKPWLAVVVASIAFGLAHLWAGPGTPLQWAVAIDTFVLSLVMCTAREYTGALWVPICMHMIKNGLAFYLLFVNPNLTDTIKSAALLLVGGN